jgi:Flp pilus assembly protein TadG
MRKSFGSSSGQIYVLVAMAMAVLIGMAGLVVDVGLLYVDRRQMQTAADAAAVAGANALQGSSSVSAGYQTAATDAAKNNGFTNGVGNVAVSVSELSCPNASSEQCVQANVSQPVPVYLLRALGYTTMNVAAKAIAGGVNSPACIYALDPTAPKAFLASGNATTTSACGILVDSSDSAALSGNGSGSVTASAIGVSGGDSLGNTTWTPTPITGIAPAPDPLASLAEPSVGSCDHTFYSTSSSASLTHGTYCGGIKISGSGTINFGPGLYVLAGGGMKVSGNAILNGSGVTFYNTSGTGGYAPIDMAGGGTATFSAPTSNAGGGIKGVLFFQDRTIAAGGSNTVTGGSSSVFDGALYFPTSQLFYAGNSNLSGNCNGSNAGYTLMIADTIAITGTASNLICDDFTTLGGTSPLQSNTFYE